MLSNLPSFNVATSARRRSAGSDLNAALDSLLGNDDVNASSMSKSKASSSRVGGNKPPPSGQPKGYGGQGQWKRRSDSDFYSSLAVQGSEGDSDSELEGAVRSDDAQKIASSMGGLDDMEASLFGSLGSSGRRGSSRRPSKTGSSGVDKQSKEVVNPRSSTSSLPLAASEEEQDDQDKELMAELTKGLSVSSSTKGSKTQQPSLRGNGEQSGRAVPTLKTADSDDLDLDDLLGDLDNGSNGSRNGDAAELKKRKPPQRPKTSHGKEVPAASERRMSKLSSDSDPFSPLEGTALEKDPTSKEANLLNLEVPPAVAKQGGAAPSARQRLSSSATDNVFDDDGDFLSDMGLGDDEGRKPLPPSTATTGKQSVTSAPPVDGLGGQPTDKMATLGSDDFFSSLGQRLQTSSMKESAPVTSNRSKQEEGEGNDVDSFQFGAYAPSSAAGRKSSLKQLQDISEEDSVSQLSSLSVRPNTAPGKKAVRFAEDLATANSSRPATSPGPQLSREREESDSGGAGLRRSEGDQKRRSTVSGFPFSNPDTRPPTGRGRRRDSSPAVVNMFEGGREHISSTTGESGEQVGGEELGESGGPHLPWERRGRKQSPLMLDSREASPQVDPRTLVTNMQPSHQPSSDTRPLSAFSSGNRASGSDDEVSTQPTTSTGEGNHSPLRNQHQQLSGKYEQEFKRYAKEVDDLKSALHTKELELQKVSELRKDHVDLLEEVARGKQSLDNAEADLKKAVTEVKALSEREKEAMHKVKLAEEARVKAIEERDEIKSKLVELETSQHQTAVVLQGEIDCLKLKYHQVELERDQAKQLVDTLQQQHSAESQTIEHSYASRLQAVEESYQKRAARWKEEQQEESVRHATKLQQAEKEKFGAVNALKRQLESLEMAHASEVDRMRETHQSALEDVRREHELTVQQLRKRHHQEVETLKSAHSHTRTLAELSFQVESSTKEFSRLQEKLEQGHRRDLEEKEEMLKAREDNLKVLEERLTKVQCESDAERSQLQGLIAKMETNLADQNRQLEKERWQLQQEWTRLQAQQAAFDEERLVSLKNVEQEKEDLQKAKEGFLKEQKRILSQCHEERRHLALERAQLQVAQKRASEKEREELHRNVQSEAELQCSKESMKEERERISAESAKVRAERERAAREKTRLRAEQERVEVLSKELQRRSTEVQELAQTAMKVKHEGENALQSAQLTKQLAEEQLVAAQAHEMSIREAQRLLASDRLSLVNERKELLALRRSQTCQNCARRDYVGSVESGGSAGTVPMGKENQYPGGLVYLPTSAPSSVRSYSPPLSLDDLTEHSRQRPSIAMSNSRDLPSTAPSFSSTDTGISLNHLQLNRSLRQFVNAAREDIESLAEEDRFLQQLAQEH